MAKVIISVKKASREQQQYFGEETWRPSFLAVVKTFKQLEDTIKEVLVNYRIPKNVLRVYYIPTEKDKPLEVSYQVILTTMEGGKQLGKRNYVGWVV